VFRYKYETLESDPFKVIVLSSVT